jgi:hypothetical protein
MDEILESLKNNSKAKNSRDNKYDGALSQYGAVYKGMNTHRNGETIEERLIRMNERRVSRDALVRQLMDENNIKYREASELIKSKNMKY